MKGIYVLLLSRARKRRHSHHPNACGHLTNRDYVSHQKRRSCINRDSVPTYSEIHQNPRWWSAQAPKHMDIKEADLPSTTIPSPSALRLEIISDNIGHPSYVHLHQKTISRCNSQPSSRWHRPLQLPTHAHTAPIAVSSPALVPTSPFSHLVTSHRADDIASEPLLNAQQRIVRTRRHAAKLDICEYTVSVLQPSRVSMGPGCRVDGASG